MRRVRFSAQLQSRSNPAASYLLFLWSESIPSLLPPSKRKRTTVGAISASANVLSKFIPSTAADDSLSTTADFTTPKRRSRFASSETLGILFRQQENHPGKLGHSSDKLVNNPGEKRPEDTGAGT